MHILIVGLPRSRTSYMASCCANQYKITNFHEDFDSEFDNLYQRASLLKKSINVDEVSKEKELFLRQVTSELFNTKGCVIKLFARHIITLTHSAKILTKTNNLAYKLIDDISSVFRIDDYDHIYIMNRNLMDAAMSFAYGKQTGNMLYLLNDPVKDKKVEIKENALAELNYFLLESIVIEQLQLFLNSNYNCINLDYSEAVNYVESNFADQKSSYKESNYNYKDLISNYNEIEDHITKFRKSLEETGITCNFT